MLTNDTRAKKVAFEEIGKVSFTIDELRLYLDTHPRDREALQMIQHHCTHRATLIENYTANFGSIEAYNPGEGDCWLWNAGPMPWEGDC